MSDIRVRRIGPLVALALGAAGGLAVHHAWRLAEGGTTDLEFVMAVAFAWLCFTTIVPYLHRDAPVPPSGSAQADYLRGLTVAVVVPVHNEDPAMFRAMLDSLAAQTRQPTWIHIVENGYDEPKLFDVFSEWRRQRCPRGVQARYWLVPEQNKRKAQVLGFNAHRCDIYVTLDSDTSLHPEAIERGLAPFADRTVMSVGGLLVGKNALTNTLTRLVELGFAGSFLNGRASWSMLGSVGVHCGALALYRGDIVRRYQRHYLEHTVAGRRMAYGDDAMLTRYSMLDGRSVIQLGCLGYTLLPERIRHLTRQRVRWWRSWFWGNLWLLRAFPPSRAIWWLTLLSYMRWALYAAALMVILLVQPVVAGTPPLMFVGWLVAVTYIMGLRYLSIRRPDQRFGTQVGTYALAPASSLLHFYLCTVLQWWGLFTCLRTGWSTRQQVEVGLHARAPRPAGARGPRSGMPGAHRSGRKPRPRAGSDAAHERVLDLIT